ncbi:MAG: glycosyltransferase [candidate division Zixibacteria bacterium]|nr:glycosyltransferase [candidate division Zixibacteria bacterium]
MSISNPNIIWGNSKKVQKVSQKEQDEKLEYGRRRIKKRPTFKPSEEKSPKETGKENNSPQAQTANSTAETQPKNKPKQKQSNSENAVDHKSKRAQSNGSKASNKKDTRSYGSGRDSRSAVKRRPLDDKSRRKDDKRKPSGRQPKRTPRDRQGRVKISVVIPAHNEAENIPILLEHLDDMFSGVNYNGEVIIVNDGSTDKTAETLNEGSSRYKFLRVCTHTNRRGLTEALETGFAVAKGEIFVFYPADLQYLPNDIPSMIQKIDEGADIVCGWRQGSYGAKKVVSFFYNSLSRMLFNVKVHDLNSVKAFKREVLQSITFRRDWHRYMVAIAADHGFNVEEVKVKLYPRRHGKSKFGFGRIFVGFFDLLSVKFQLTVMKKPMLLFGMGGLLSGIIGVLLGIVALYMRFVEHNAFRPILYLVMLLIINGLLLFAMGFLAEALVNIKDEIRSLHIRKKL